MTLDLPISDGSHLTGFVSFDGSEDFPHIVGTLECQESRLLLTIPRLLADEDPKNAHFQLIQEWEERGGPELLLFTTFEGELTLGDLHYGQGGVSAVGVLQTRVYVGTAAQASPRDWTSGYVIAELESALDGLDEFCGFKTVHTDATRDDQGTVTSARVRVDAYTKVTWKSDSFRYSLQPSPSFQVVTERTGSFSQDKARLSTASLTSPTSVSKHLQAQRPLQALLTIAYDRPIGWGTHRATDNNYPTWSLARTILAVGPNPVQVSGHSPSTAAELERLRWPALQLNDMGANGLQRWFERWQQDSPFQYAVRLLVAVCSGHSPVLEGQLTLLATCLDRFGHLLKEEKYAHMSICRALSLLPQESLDPLGGAKGLASALNTLNNDLKHPDREAELDPTICHRAVRVARAAARCIAAHWLGLSADVWSQLIARTRVAEYCTETRREGIVVKPAKGKDYLAFQWEH